MTASRSVLLCIAAARRTVYGLESTNSRGSVEARLASNSSHLPSSSRSCRRVGASMRKWGPHLGQTWKPSSRALRQVIWPQLSHLAQRPSVLTVRAASSGGSELTEGCLRVHQLMRYPRLRVTRGRYGWQGLQGLVVGRRQESLRDRCRDQDRCL